MTAPLVSCLMATYGRHSLVERSLACFLRQDFIDSELIILNNNPLAMHLDPDVPAELAARIRIVNESDYGTLGACRNRLLQLARGEYVRTWDDDDIYLPWSLSQGVEGLRTALANNPKTPAWKPERSWWINGQEPAALAGNAMEASILTRKEIAEKYPYRESGGDEHSPLLEGFRSEGGLATTEMGIWTGYCYMWGQGNHHISGSLGSSDPVAVRTWNWMQAHQDTPDRPLTPNFAAAEEIWAKISKSCEGDQLAFEARCARPDTHSIHFD